MSIPPASFLFVLAFVTLARGDVQELTQSTFSSGIKGSKVAVVLFYAPWCGHCKKLAPEFSQAADVLKEQALFAKVDSTVETDLASEFETASYPSIKVFFDGVRSTWVDYHGPKKAVSLISFVQRMLLPAVTEVQSDDELASLMKSTPLLVVGRFPEEAKAERHAFEGLAKKNRGGDFKYVVMRGDEAAVTLHKDGGKVDYNGNFLPEELQSFVSGESFPPFGEMTPDLFPSYAARGLPIAWLFTDASESSADAKRVMEQLAPSMKGKISFVWVDAMKYSPMAEALGLPALWPALAVEDGAKHYAMGSQVTRSRTEAWLQSYLAEKIEPTIRSERPPATPVKEGLTTLVGSNIMNVISRQQSHILLLLYAPWCGHCKAMRPAFEEVAKKFENDNRITVAQMDAVKNDVPEQFEIKGYPSIFLITKQGTTVPFIGDRTYEELVAFIQKNTDLAVEDEEL